MQKTRSSLSRQSLIGTLIIVTTIAMAFPSTSRAMLAPTQVINGVHQPSDTRADDLKTIQKALESKIIRQRLTDFKLSPEQIDSRLSKLSDAQIHKTAMQIKTVNPGGDSGDFLISILLIAVLVALFMYIFRRI